MVVYRIENRQGHGPFFRKDGTPRDGAPFKNLEGILHNMKTLKLFFLSL